MKKIFSLIMLVCCVGMFTACSDDRDDNPVLQQPETFTLNQPAYSAGVDLQNGKSIAFTWSQPAYGFPAGTEYQLQVSNNGKFTKELDVNADPATQLGVADHVTLLESYKTCDGPLFTKDMAKALQQLNAYEEGKVPATDEVWVRCVASTKGAKKVYSNAVKLSVVPYYVELKDAVPATWYLIGSCIGDGKWTNAEAAIGVSMMPLYTKAGETYDKATGDGKFEYTGYFPADANFKIVKTPGDWDHYVWCTDGTPLGTSLRNGGSDPGNITVPAAGYYTITLDTKALKCVIKPAASTPSATYAMITMPGTPNGWDAANGNPMTPVSASPENHDWFTTITFDANAPADGGTKFAKGSWDESWGIAEFPFGIASGSANIPYKKGTFKVFFNDYTKQFFFIEQ